MKSPLLNEKQAAERLAVSCRTLQAWRLRNYGPRPVKLSRAVRYSPAELDRFIQEQTRDTRND